jgi:RimJ/RimL family protein N-acetyltransferase
MSEPVCITWRPVDSLTTYVALEPRGNEIATFAPRLAAAYNDPHNATLMGNTEEMSADDVVAHYADMTDEGARQFLLFVDDDLVGDADLRDIDATSCEFAFMIADRAQQGKGLGTRFATMLHALAFQSLRLEKIYAAIVPANVGSRRVFEKLGYTIDTSAAARMRADEHDDVVMSIDAATFAAGRSHSDIAIANR